MGFELSTIIQLISSTIAISVIGLVINWKLTAIMVCLIPVVILSSRLFSKVSSAMIVCSSLNIALAAHRSRSNQRVHVLCQSRANRSGSLQFAAHGSSLQWCSIRTATVRDHRFDVEMFSHPSRVGTRETWKPLVRTASERVLPWACSSVGYSS